MKPRKRRLLIIAGGLATLGLATTFVLNAFRENLVFFFSPSQVLAEQAPKSRSFRIGGLVEPGTIARSGDGLTVHFDVTDSAKSVRVHYTGILPDLFREGKGVVAQGRLSREGVFLATEVLAKHDENYMPPEAARALEQARHARDAGSPTQ